MASRTSAPKRPRRPETKGEATRLLILAAAARAIRIHGPAGVSVVEVMREAGLTHGGFYAHFASKEALVAEAIHHMFAGGEDRFAARTATKSGPDALKTWISAYVSREHRDNPGGGCALAALISDMPRLEAAARAAFDQGVQGIAHRLSRHLPAGVLQPENIVCSLLAEMAGAVALSRAVSDRTFSDRILRQSRTALCARIDGMEKS